ncbi:MAG: hypothetical protein NTY09_13545 [bacterium]|nr:hypothetical protein [bacterium]
MGGPDDILKSLIIALLRKAGEKGLTKTQVIKLVFFCDLESARTNGILLTKCQYRTDHHGVVSYEAWDVAESLADTWNIVYSKESSFFRSPSYRVTLIKDCFPVPDEKMQGIVEAVWVKYGGLTATQLGLKTKELVPMESKWEEGITVDPRDIAYEESGEFNKMAENFSNKYPEGYGPVEPVNIED